MTKKIEVKNLNYGNGMPTPALEVRDNHEGTPCVYFTNFDTKELHDGFTVSEMYSVVAAINMAMSEQSNRALDRNQLPLDFGHGGDTQMLPMDSRN